MYLANLQVSSQGLRWLRIEGRIKYFLHRPERLRGHATSSGPAGCCQKKQGRSRASGINRLNYIILRVAKAGNHVLAYRCPGVGFNHARLVFPEANADLVG